MIISECRHTLFHSIEDIEFLIKISQQNMNDNLKKKATDSSRVSQQEKISNYIFKGLIPYFKLVFKIY